MDEPGLRERVRHVCMAYPETSEVVKNPLHSGFEVRGKTFAYYLNDHHGDGRLVLTMKGLPGALDVLQDVDPERFFAPPYMARWGWVGLYLDVEPVDWGQVDSLIEDAWRATAPKTVLKKFEAARASQ